MSDFKDGPQMNAARNLYPMFYALCTEWLTMKELLETGVDTDLGYSGKCDALTGRIRDLSVVIKENNATKSYGCLIWVKKKNSTSDDELYSYLSEQVAAKPHIIKHFKTTGRGAALALVKYNDPVRNIKNINRFLGDLADDLYAHDYMNCCYACGKTEGLAIYKDGAAVVQYCGSCARGVKIEAGDEPDPADEPVIEAASSSGAATDMVTVEDLMADPGMPADTGDDDDRITINSDDGADLSGLMADESDLEPEKPEPVRIERPTEDVKPDSSLDQLMYSEETAKKENSEPAFGNANTYIDADDDGSADIGGLMFDENDVPAEEPDEAAKEIKEAENANIYGLMIGSEQEIAETGDAEVKVLATTEIGTGSDIQVTVQEEEEFGTDAGVQVTELVDDSNEGEDIQIEALRSDFNKPTDTKGGEIAAKETPLEKDGSVPMVNPNSDYADVRPSPVRDKNAVRAFAYGSYENANTAEEPVGFDGRPKGYKRSDPRLGDEMGSVSRDYSRQNAAVTAPGAKPPRPEGYKVVSKAGASRMKPIKQSKPAYAVGSNAVVGTIAALLFGVIACALWCGIAYVLGLMGTFDATVKTVILAVLGLLPGAAVFLGYRVGGDCWDGKGIVISAILGVISDAVGLAAVFILSDMQAKAEELGYGIPIDKAWEDVGRSFSDPALSGAMNMQLWLTIAVMAVTLVVAVVVSKKKI